MICCVWLYLGETIQGFVVTAQRLLKVQGKKCAADAALMKSMLEKAHAINIHVLCCCKGSDTMNSINLRKDNLYHCLDETAEYLAGEIRKAGLESYIVNGSSRSRNIFMLGSWPEAHVAHYLIPLTALRSRIINRIPVRIVDGKAVACKKTLPFGNLDEVSCVTLGKECVEKLVSKVLEGMKHYKAKWNSLYFGKVLRCRYLFTWVLANKIVFCQ